MFPCPLYGLAQGNGKHQSCCVPEGDGNGSASPQSKGNYFPSGFSFVNHLCHSMTPPSSLSRRHLLPLCGHALGHGCSQVFGASRKKNHGCDFSVRYSRKAQASYSTVGHLLISSKKQWVLLILSCREA